jgi:hypothetical protein
MAVFLLILALGTFWFFPRLARVLVGCALVGVLGLGLDLAGWTIHEAAVVTPARNAHLDAGCQFLLALHASPKEPTVDELIRVVDGPSLDECQARRLVTRP